MSNLTESMVRANQEYSKEKAKKKVKESKKVVKEYLDKFAYDETSEEDQGLFDWIGSRVADTIFSPSDFTFEEDQAFSEAIDSLVKVYKSVKARRGNKVAESKKIKESEGRQARGLYPGRELTSKSGHKVTITDVVTDYSEYDGSPDVTVYYNYEMTDGTKGNSYCNTVDLWNMLKESRKRVKEEITKDNYKIYRTCLDIVTDGSTPKIGPGSKFVNSLYRAVEDNGYALLNDSYSFDFEDVTDIYNEEDIDWILDEGTKINEGYNSKLDPALDRVVTDYLKYKSQRKDLLGAGNTDKKSVKLKAELLDKKLKELRDEWKDLISQMGSGYQEILSKTDKNEPSKTALKRIKELHQQSKKS